jgi:hypothetical protein
VDVSLKTNSLLLKDTSSIEILKETINSLQNAVLSLHASYSQKLNFNESKKSEAKLKINQVLQD